LGIAYANKGDFDRAIELFLKALAMFKIALPNTHPDIIGTYKNIIVAFLKKGDDENAQKYYDEMINF
ncbi:MAG: tetratricopeptide repeat protein, partial [Clostridia bacterium]|nr:tetratricopeptide repeat protein [Clostridia bacterium]